jgi:hypothetical protein
VLGVFPVAVRSGTESSAVRFVASSILENFMCARSLALTRAHLHEIEITTYVSAGNGVADHQGTRERASHECSRRSGSHGAGRNSSHTHFAKMHSLQSEPRFGSACPVRTEGSRREPMSARTLDVVSLDGERDRKSGAVKCDVQIILRLTPSLCLNSSANLLPVMICGR